MQEINYKNIHDFLIDIFETCENSTDITIVTKPNNVINIIKELFNANFNIESITLDNIDYDKEYYINISDDGVWCTKAYNVENSKYYYEYPDIAYVLGDCNSKILEYIDSVKFVINID